MRLIRLAPSSILRPDWSTPQLLLTVRRSSAPVSSSASMSDSGTPHRPNPPTASEEPEKMSVTASEAELTVLSNV